MKKTNDAKESQKLFNIRHSLAHIMASAVLEMFPKAKLGVGPVIENGFYYDFLLPRALTPDDLSKLEKRMRALVNEKIDFKREELTPDQALRMFSEAHQDFKVELINDLKKYGTTNAKELAAKDEAASVDLDPASATISIYRSGKFVDLCKGPHVSNTREIRADAFKLDKVSGAYWRGDQKNPQMQRVYGLAFETKQELDEYIKLQEEIAKRDHRVVGPKLGLFSFNELSPGIPYYEPNGMIIRNELEKFVREYSYGEGYSEVKLPQLFDAELWKTSGHWEHYKDDMFLFKIEGRDFALKPMNCPGHMTLFKQSLHSYRDLPVRFAEMTTLFRNELTGALSGLTRVRGFAQDDCHIFLAPEQISAEVAELLKRIQKIYKVFGMKIEDVYLSTRPEKSMGETKDWELAERSLADALKKAKWDFKINPGDGAFYGPKIDMQIKDILGRKWQLATIQLDFQMPKRFGLEYIDKDGSRKAPIVIHRALIGSFERFFAILIEHYGGAFPLWLSPVQVSILPISKKQNLYAKKVEKELKEMAPELRIKADNRDESVGKKIREATMMKVPYQIILGEKEAKGKKVAIRTREGKDLGQIPLKKFVERIKTELEKKK